MKKLFILVILLISSSSPAFAGLKAVVSGSAMQVTPTGSSTSRTLADVLADAVNVKSWGAAGIGDATTILNSACAYAKTNAKAVYFPSGIYYHSGLVTCDSVKIYGDGRYSILSATATSGSNPQNALKLTGTGVEVHDMKISTAWVGTRQTTRESAAVFVSGASDFKVEGLEIPGSASAGILVTSSSTRGTIKLNTIYDTLADGIHVTGNSSYVSVDTNTVYNTGDDKIAVVSYNADSAISHDINIINNFVSGGSARGITVDGGQRVNVLANHVNDINNTGAIYIASESSYDTNVAKDILVSGNFVDNFTVSSGNSGAIYVTGRSTYPASNIIISNNYITNTFVQGISLNASDAGGVVDVSIKGNTLRQSASATAGMGILLRNVAGTTEVKNNDIFDFWDRGINSDGTNSGTAIIDGNLISNHARGGGIEAIYAPNGTKSIVTNNIQKNGGTALTSNFLISYNADTLVSGNSKDMTGGYAVVGGSSAVFSVGSGKLLVTGDSPTISSCGTSPSISGADSSFEVLMGSGALTSCVINFVKTWPTAPKNCNLTPKNAAAAAWGTTGAYVSAISTTQLTISGSNLTSARYGVQCF